MKIFSKSDVETESIAKELATKMPSGGVFLLIGDLGAGKTAFARGLAAGYGFNGRVNSPTFTLVHEYKGNMPICHFDLYRLVDEDELWDIGFFEYINNNSVCIIEWPNDFMAIMPENSIVVRIDRANGDDERYITIEGE